MGPNITCFALLPELLLLLPHLLKVVTTTWTIMEGTVCQSKWLRWRVVCSWPVSIQHVSLLVSTQTRDMFYTDTEAAATNYVCASSRSISQPLNADSLGTNVECVWGQWDLRGATTLTLCGPAVPWPVLNYFDLTLSQEGNPIVQLVCHKLFSHLQDLRSHISGRESVLC